ncbi:MAG: zinc-finger domain-containing protein [Rhodospirillaceae bacterium]|nr:zinc-finger domain-containing protein [Rhodospirillaceae bacterium]
MAEALETIKVETTQVNCDGGGGALGHPRVYLHIKPEVGHIDCPYCGRRYKLSEQAKAHAGAGH